MAALSLEVLLRLHQINPPLVGIFIIQSSTSVLTALLGDGVGKFGV